MPHSTVSPIPLKFDKEDIISSILGSMKPLLFAENLVGVFRFSQQNGRLTEPKLVQKLFGGLISIYPIILLYFDRKITNTITNILHVPSYCVIVLEISIFYCKENIKFLNMLSNIDLTLKVENIVKHHDYFGKCFKTLIIMIFIMIFVCLWHFSLVAIGYMASYRLLLIPSHFVLYIDLFIFTQYVIMLKNRIRLLTDRLSMFLANISCHDADAVGKNKFYYIFNEQVILSIKELAKMYKTTAEGFTLLNRSNSFHCVLVLINTFTECYLLTYTIRRVVLGAIVIENVYWLIFILQLMKVAACWIYIAIVFSEIHTLYHPIKVLLNEIIMNYYLSRTVRVDAKAFMKLLQMYPIHLKLCGTFNIDNSLLGRFGSTLVTTVLMSQQLKFEEILLYVFTLLHYQVNIGRFDYN